MGMHETSIAGASSGVRPLKHSGPDLCLAEALIPGSEKSSIQPTPYAAEEVRDATSVQHLTRLLTSAAQGLGFDYFSYIFLRGPQDGSSNNHLIQYISNQTSEWQFQYKRDRLQDRDPVVFAGRVSRSAFAWDVEKRDLCIDFEHEQAFSRARKFRIRCGITLPVHGPNRELSLFTLSSEAEREDLERLLPEIGPLMLVFAVNVGLWMERHTSVIDGTPDGCLSSREKECLLWTARGKTSWEIAKIIDRSPATVNFHLKNAACKLDASNKCHAVSKAITQGQLFF